MMKGIYTLWCLLCIICQSYQRYVKVCSSDLGMEDGSIKDSQLSASSASSGLVAAKHGRLNEKGGYGAWCPLQDHRWYTNLNGGPYYDQYFEVRFLKPVRITAVGTQGRSKNHGNEGVEDFFVQYSLMTSGSVEWKTFHGWKQPQPKKFSGNKYKMNVTKMNYFRPPFVADTFRLVPEIYPVNQACLRLELYGCDVQQDLISYTMNAGNVRSPGYNLTDLIFDGVVTPSKLYSGLGFLTDGHLAHENFVENKGYGWIGWQNRQTRSPTIVFHFLRPRVFKSVTFHCNVRTRSGIELFKSVKISFGADNVTLHSSVTHDTVIVDSGYKWINYNVTVDLCQHYGHLVKMQFAYAGEWMLISEVMLDSYPLNVMHLPKPECKPVTAPPAILPTEPIKSTTPELNNTAFGPKPESSSGLDDGAVIGIVCGTVFVILIIVVSLCCCWYRKRRHHQKRPSFYNFIRWELKPYSSYRNAVRVSRLESTGEEEKNYTFKRQEQNGEAGNFVVPVDAESAIYASIKNLEEVGKPQEQPSKKWNKSGKPKNKPPPLPIDAPHCADVEHYALPDTPFIGSQSMDEDGYCSPEPKSPLLSPPISPLPSKPEEPNQSDVFYAEPDAPPQQTGGYSEPIDAVLPGEGIFRNPIYEEIYSEPYQGVSGTSLYANPSTALRTRQDTFKEFPREKLIFKEKIGDGQFGEVHLGEAEGLSEFLGEDMNTNKRVLVAIKKLKPEVDKNIKEDFFKEVKVMSGIQHENVIRLLGVCRDDPMCMIVEYMVNGDLNQFLKERELAPGTKGNKEKVLTYQALIYMALQVAAGMKYISSLKFVHRDLATRNCLVGHSYTVKIADFGMSRHLYSKHYYRVHGRVILPIRWMAPECILQGKFTSESDVWAFAVTLWEILTLAAEYPYNDLTDEQVIENVQRMFFRPTCPQVVYLGQPSICPGDVYDMMKSCWQKDPATRPNFVDIHAFMKSRVRLSEMAI